MRAVILCAGMGSRLGNLTTHCPKPLLIVAGKPIVEHMILKLKLLGIKFIAINLHYRSEDIQNYLGDGSKYGVTLKYFVEEKLLGTAGALVPMTSWLMSDPEDSFVVVYGDLVFEDPFGDIIMAHANQEAVATLMVHPTESSNSILLLQRNQKIIYFAERPTDEEQKLINAKFSSAKKFANSGVAFLRKEILWYMYQSKAFDLPRDVFMPLIKQGQALYGVPVSGWRVAVDSPDRLELANQYSGRLI